MKFIDPEIYSKYKEEIDQAYFNGIQEGKQEGKLEEKQETARKAYQMAMSLESISQLTNLSIADLQEIFDLSI